MRGRSLYRSLYRLAPLLLLVLGAAGADLGGGPEAGIPSGLQDASAVPFEPGRVLVRLAPDRVSSLAAGRAPGESLGERVARSGAFAALPAAVRVVRSRALFERAAVERAATAAPGEPDWRRGVFAVDYASDLELDAVLAAFRALPDVERAQPSYVYTADVTPSDPQFALQYAHALTQAEAGWDIETGDREVVIAVLGTGIQLDHPDLAGNVWVNEGEVYGNGIDDDQNGYVDDAFGWDFIDGDGLPDPGAAAGDSHETEVAGVAAAVADNGQGIAGVSWSSRWMALRIDYVTEDVAAAIDYAVANGASVINMSFGNYTPSKYGPDSIVEDAVLAAAAAGVVLVATAGNDAVTTPRYPAALDDVIAVAATDAADQRASFSNYGTWIDVAAPGVGIQSTTTGSQYAAVSGTSFAAPYVSGLAALVVSEHPGLAPASVRKRIIYSVDKIATDLPVGTGRVNVARALALGADPAVFAVIQAPRPGNPFPALLRVEGIVLGDSYSLAYHAEGEVAWSDFATGPGPASGALGELDTEDLPPGVVELRLRAFSGGESDEHVIAGIHVGVQDLLPGWPRSNGDPFPSLVPPVFADLDGDGDLEVLSATTYLRAWHHDGSLVAGWPQSADRPFGGAPSVGDIDGDGDVEVVSIGYNSLLSAWHHDGTPVFSPRQLVVGGHSRSAPVLADLDGDGSLEIVVSAYGSSNHASVWALSGDGTILPGWPVVLPQGNLQSSPTLADLDGDGAVEILAHSYFRLFALRADGTPVPGWPIALLGNHIAPAAVDLDGDRDDEVLAFGRSSLRLFDGDGAPLDAINAFPDSYTHPAVGDVDDDGVLEVCFGGSAGVHLVGFATHGERPGWPKAVGSKASCSIADVDGDGTQEILVATEGSHLYAWEPDGSPVAPGLWPRLLGSGIYGSPTIADLEGDGSLEAGVLASDGMLWIYTFDTAPGGAPAHWPTYQANVRHTGKLVLPEPALGASLLAGIALLAALATSPRWT